MHLVRCALYSPSAQFPAADRKSEQIFVHVDSRESRNCDNSKSDISVKATDSQLNFGPQNKFRLAVQVGAGGRQFTTFCTFCLTVEHLAECLIS